MRKTTFYTTSVIAHIDHGKTTFVDSLLAHGGFISKSMAGTARLLNTRRDEQTRGITMKNSIIRIQEHFFIDTPGHADFEQCIYSASILSDNFILIIDVNEGITPRTYSLIKFIDRNRTILVLNKIEQDKELPLFDIESIIQKINTMLKEEIFSWDKNNVVLTSAILCMGISHHSLKEKVSAKNNTIKHAIKCIKALDEKIEKKDVDGILKKYNIKNVDRKMIFNKVFNLSETIFEMLQCFDKIEKKQTNLINFINCTDELKAISTFAIPIRIVEKEQDILHIFKIISGCFTVGDDLITNDEKIIKIGNIYTFKGEQLMEIQNAKEGMLIGVRGSFVQNATLAREHTFTIAPKTQFNAVYKTKLALDNIEEKEELKTFFKQLALIENGLRVRKNRFCEFEVGCFGELQFDKICEDLKDAGFNFKVRGLTKRFIECCKQRVSMNNENFDITIDESNKESNEIEIYAKESEGIIKSAIAAFCKNGPLIREKIGFTKFTIRSSGKTDYNEFKNVLESLYIGSKPCAVAYYYNMRVYLLHNYLNIMYRILQKYNAIVEKENYEEENEFFIMECKIPQFQLHNAISDIRRECKGTVYFELEKGCFCVNESFADMINELQEEKGMISKKKIVETGTKQRTLKK